MGKYEVTQAQWEAVMGGNPSNFKGPNLSVENVSLEDIQGFIQLREFIKDEEVLSIREYFFNKKILPTAVGRFFSADLQRPRRLTRNPANGSWRMLQVRPAWPTRASGAGRI
jgi:hypothetical protein